MSLTPSFSFVLLWA